MCTHGPTHIKCCHVSGWVEKADKAFYCLQNSVKMIREELDVSRGSAHYCHTICTVKKDRGGNKSKQPQKPRKDEEQLQQHFIEPAKATAPRWWLL